MNYGSHDRDLQVNNRDRYGKLLSKNPDEASRGCPKKYASRPLEALVFQGSGSWVGGLGILRVTLYVLS